MRDHAERKRGLAHGRPSAHHDQRAGLQPGQELVQIEVAGGRTRDGVAPLVELLETIEVLGQEARQLLRAVGDSSFVDLVDEGLGAVERLADVLGHRVAQLRDLAGHPDEPSQERILLHDAGVARRVGGGGRGRHDLREHGVPADGLEQARPTQLIGDRDGVRRLPGGVEGVHGVVDVAVRGLVEVGGRHHAGGVGDGAGGQHHGAEEGLLGLQVVRRDSARGYPGGGGFLVVGSGGHGGFTLRQRACGLPEAQPWGNPGDVDPLAVDGPVENPAF